MIKIKYISILFFIFVWQGLSMIINSSVFPSILDIGYELINHIRKEQLLDDLQVTLFRVFISFILTMIIGIFFGILMGASKKINDFFDFLLILGLNIPAIVVIIISYIWFGLTEFAAIFAVIINKTPIVIVNIREGTRVVEKKYMDLGKVYKVSKKDTFFKIFLPQLYPYILASIRLTLSLTWKIVLVVELLGLSSGIGFRISMFFQFFDIASILAYSFAFILIIISIEKFILVPFERKILQWK